MLDHDTPHWPPLATDGSPATWAPVYFGTNPPAHANRLPIAQAGHRQNIRPRAARQVFLDGSDSFDPDGDALTFRWSQTGGPLMGLINPGTATPSFLAQPVTSPTPLTFSLTVNDGTADSASSQVDVWLLPPSPRPPPASLQGFTHLRSDGQLQIRLIGNPQQQYRIQMSEDFNTWTNLRTVYADFSGRIDLTQILDLQSHPRLFFRAISP